jgi:two-component system CheB/CheR fusion protein
VRQLDAVDAYVTLLKQDAKELNVLFKDLLIGVTQFFRDPDVFAALAREVIPALFADKGVAGQVCVGVSGCASGEEAYSIAILLCEHLATIDVAPRVQIRAARKDAVPRQLVELPLTDVRRPRREHDARQTLRYNARMKNYSSLAISSHMI